VIKARPTGEPAPLIDLVRRSAAGEAQAFRALYDATAPKLFGVVLRIVRDRGVAEEVLQEAYLKVWQKAAVYNPDLGGPLAWLVTVARHAAIDRIRSREHATTVATALTDEAVLERLAVEGAPGVDAVARQALRDCLGRLDEEARVCVVLAYCEGYSRDELAERLGRPVGTVKTWLHRSLKALAECLGT